MDLEQASVKQQLAQILRADRTLTLRFLETFILPPELASKLTDKVFALSREPKKNTLPSLVDLCAALVASDKSVVDTLYAIYGPDTNFPFPWWVAPKVHQLCKVDDLESVCKLALLLANSTSVWASLSTGDAQDDTEATRALGQLVWTKLSSLCRKLQHLELKYWEEGPELSETKMLLPAVQRLSDLRVLDAPQTVFLDADLQILGASLPQLRSLTFMYDGQVTEVGVQALGQLKKLEELLFSPYNEYHLGLDEFILARDVFISRCLGALPWLKVLCSTVEDEDLFDHIMPVLEEKRVLSLTNLQFTPPLRVDNNRSLTFFNGTLPNVRFLKIFDLEEDGVVECLREKDVFKVEQLYIQMCHPGPTYDLIKSIGHNLSVLTQSKKLHDKP